MKNEINEDGLNEKNNISQTSYFKNMKGGNEK